MSKAKPKAKKAKSRSGSARLVNSTRRVRATRKEVEATLGIPFRFYEPSIPATLEDLARPHKPFGEGPGPRSGGSFVVDKEKGLIPTPAAMQGPEHVKHPAHYNRGGIECCDAAEAMMLEWPAQTAYRIGQAYQYLYRHRHKGEALKDLRKAQFWIQREIDALEKTSGLDFL